MARKVSDQVTTIGIDIGKNTFHIIGLFVIDRTSSFMYKGKAIDVRQVWPI